jgi:hypothetical protein
MIGRGCGPVHLANHAGDRRRPDRGLGEQLFDDLFVELTAVRVAKGPAPTAVLGSRGHELRARRAIMIAVPPILMEQPLGVLTTSTSRQSERSMPDPARAG